jgi:nucleotide-binding universal stress UspA family protein
VTEEPTAPAVGVKRILCPIDFSDTTAHVVEQAVAIAGWYHARILALHVYSPVFAPVPTLPPPVERVPQAEIARVQENMRACFEAALKAGIRVDVAVDIGRPAVEILDALLPFKRVLCAVDFSDPSLTAAQYARSIANESGAALTLLHVIEWPWVESPMPAYEDVPHEQAAALAEFRRYLETTAMARLKTLVPTTDRAASSSNAVVRHGRPYVEILRLAEATRADLIVIGVHGRNVVDMTLFGSTTNQVVRRATCPVLTMRP